MALQGVRVWNPASAEATAGVVHLGAQPAASERYRTEEGKNVVRCEEAPGLDVSVDAKNQYSESEARKLGKQVILLDGAGLFAPVVDGESQFYNLDHHAACVRPFTLATCEQALVLVAKGLTLDKGDWTIYANEPDLDTVLAIWVLLNHRRILKLSDRAREVLLPLLRMEGAIDANGTNFAQWCGLAEPALTRTRERLDALFARERELRDAGKSPVERALEMLREVDALILTPAELSEFKPLEEVYGYVELGGDRVAVACKDAAGIYDVDERLREVWGSRLGMIVLKNAPGKYTLRVSSAPGTINLEKVYDLLNAVDPAVDGQPPSERWGGADDIGGSPREHGSRLVPERVLQVVHWAVQRTRRPWSATLEAFTASAAIAFAAAVAATAWWAAVGLRQPPAIDASAALAVFGAVAGSSSVWLARRREKQALWLPVWRKPVRWDWAWLAPVALLASVLGGAWLPAHVETTWSGLALAAGGASVAAVGLEAWFRNLVQTPLLLERLRPDGGKRWRLTAANCVAATLFCVATLCAQGLLIGSSPLVSRLAGATGSGALLITAIGAGLLGLTLGAVRERAGSLWPGIGLQVAGAATALGLAAL